MVLLGLILLIIGLLAYSPLVIIGVIVLVVGLILNFAPGPWVGGGGSRRRYY